MQNYYAKLNLKFYLRLNVWIKTEFHFHATPHVLLGMLYICIIGQLFINLWQLKYNVNI